MQIRIFTYLILFIISFQISAMADNDKPAYNVFIDTDGALDDFRAINMFLAGKDFNVLGITGSQGTLTADNSFQKVNSLISFYRHEGIPVGMSKSLSSDLPSWSTFAQNISWSDIEGTLSPQDAIQLLENGVAGSKDKVTLVALGSLNTYAQWIKNTKQDIAKIEQIVWYNEPDLATQFNYLLDKKAYEEILKSKVPLVVVSKGQRQLNTDIQYTDHLKPLRVVYVKRVMEVLNSKSVKDKILEGHSQLWDDLVPLYLSHPDLFAISEKSNYTNAVLNQDIPAANIFADVAQILNSKIEAMNRVFEIFPLQPSLYKNDYSPIVEPTVDQYGLAEWKSIVLTNEVHGHTGIYSIIGAKAGIRACEYFNVGVNNLFAVSYAGNKPPLSCFNDGIQISTGATIGQGLIKVSDQVLSIPTVDFEYNGRKIKLSLKKEIADKMQADIKKGIAQYGMTRDYWVYIEKLAKDYWTDFDRHDIFDIEKI